MLFKVILDGVLYIKSQLSILIFITYMLSLHQYRNRKKVDDCYRLMYYIIPPTMSFLNK